MSRPVQSKPTQDIGIAQRFSLFRKQYIDEKQIRAAEAIGMPQAYLSQVENGTRPLTLKYIKVLVDKFQLNTEWLTKNVGEKQLRNPAKPTASTSLGAAHDAIKTLETVIENQNFIMKGMLSRIEKQDKLIAALQARMDKMEDGK